MNKYQEVSLSETEFKKACPKADYCNNRFDFGDLNGLFQAFKW